MRGLLALIVLLLCSCDGGGLPEGWRETPDGTGPEVRWEPGARPFPEIPLPNDLATWPDPTSPTGRRLNASMLAPTVFEEHARENLDRLDGWSTFGPISVSFDLPIDLNEFIDDQGGAQWSADDFQTHAVYLIDLETGIPVPLDFNAGNVLYSLESPNKYWDNDPRGEESNIMFETVEEDLNGNGRLDPGEDTDFDGVLDHPNGFDRDGDGTFEPYDEMVWFWERETNTLILRSVVPLREQHTYAVVLTDRLRGEDGQSVRSPFEDVHHVTQRDALAQLPDLFRAQPEIYGDLATRGWEGVAFAWTFSTQSITGDLLALRDGLYGHGPFAYLAEDFPPDLTPLQLRGGTEGFTCDDPGPRVFIATPAQTREAIEFVAEDAFGLDPDSARALLDSFDESVSHFVFAFFESPYLLGNPDLPDLDATWDIDRRTGRATVNRDQVRMVITIPKETAEHSQPFPVTFYAHGYGTLAVESLGFSGKLARQGIATVSIDAVGHGIALEPVLSDALGAIFDSECLHGLGNALRIDRARDQNFDGDVDSGADVYTAYLFHSRDVMRQTALDAMNGLRILRNLQGAPGRPSRNFVPGVVRQRVDPDDVTEVEEHPFGGDVTADGAPDLAGDFDGDGTPDLGGWDNDYYVWGQSFGGFMSALLLGAEPVFQAGAPADGGGGLADLAARSREGGFLEAVMLRTMGPLVISIPSTGPGPDNSCAAGELSLRIVVPDIFDTRRIEFACVPSTTLAEDDVVIVRNLFNEEARCAAADDEGRFRVGIPADRGDFIQVEIYDAARLVTDFATCRFTDGAARSPTDVISTWRSGATEEGLRCRDCARYQRTRFAAGDPLVTPVEGLGLARQTPDLRRFIGLGQLALDPADSANWARRIFLEPPAPTEDFPMSRPRSLLVIHPVGDHIVTDNTSATFARAAGVLPFLPADAPDALADWRAPSWFSARYGLASPNDVLVRQHVLEGIARLERHPLPGAGAPANFLVDVDDLSEGRQLWLPDGDRQLRDDEDPLTGFPSPTIDPPLRWVRESRTATRHAMPPDESVWSPDAMACVPLSGVLFPTVYPTGNHGIEPSDPRKRFDEGEYLTNLIALWMQSGGVDLRYHLDPDDHHCLEDTACVAAGVEPVCTGR
jgi:hypothetical protein